MDAELDIQIRSAGNPDSEARLIDLVLDGVTSGHSRRSYRTGLTAFFGWIRVSGGRAGVHQGPGPAIPVGAPGPGAFRLDGQPPALAHPQTRPRDGRQSAARPGGGGGDRARALGSRSAATGQGTG